MYDKLLLRDNQNFASEKLGNFFITILLPQAFFTSEKPSVYAGFRGSVNYSHSIVAGGLLVMSYTTRLTPSTSLIMRLEVRPNRS